MTFKMLTRILFAINLFGAGFVYIGVKRAYARSKFYKLWLVLGFGVMFLSWVWFAGELGASDMVPSYGLAIIGVAVAMKSLDGRIVATLSSTVHTLRDRSDR